MRPPAPISCGNGVYDVDAAATASTESAVAAHHKIETQLLTLAREIRSPHAYVGYSTFILMGLAKKCQPCVWEGASHIDLPKVFAPWATECCTLELPVAAVPFAHVATPSEAVE